MARSIGRRKRDRSSSRSRSSFSSRSYSTSSSSTTSSSPSSSSMSSRSRSRSTSSSRSTASRFSRSSRASRKNDRNRTPVPICRVQLNRLTKNVNKNHLVEIFKNYGNVRNIEVPSDRHHPHLNKGTAFIEFESADQADQAIKYMDGGQIDGQEILISRVYNKPAIRQKPSKNGRRSPPRR